MKNNQITLFSRPVAEKEYWETFFLCHPYFIPGGNQKLLEKFIQLYRSLLPLHFVSF
jgi:hypothetical protein